MRTLSVLRAALYGGFLFCDHLMWCGKTNVLPFNADKWNMRAMRLWFVALVVSIVRDLYKVSASVLRARQQSVVAS